MRLFFFLKENCGWPNTRNSGVHLPKLLEMFSLKASWSSSSNSPHRDQGRLMSPRVAGTVVNIWNLSKTLLVLINLHAVGWGKTGPGRNSCWQPWGELCPDLGISWIPFWMIWYYLSTFLSKAIMLEMAFVVGCVLVIIIPRPWRWASHSLRTYLCSNTEH